MKMRPASPALGLLLASLLAGCGGGGSGGDAGIPSTTNYAVASAYRNFASASFDITATGTGSDSNRYTVRVQQERLSDAAFPVTGNTARVIRQTLTVSAAGRTATTAGNQYFDAVTLAPLGSYVPETGECTRTTGYTPLPAVANVGANGALGTESDLAACSPTAAVTDTTNTRWSLEAARGADGGSFALLCQGSEAVASANSPSGAVSICIEIATDGSLGNRLRFFTRIANSPLFELTATNY